MNGMLSPFNAKKEETKRLLSYIVSFGTLVPLGILEEEKLIEVAFRVPKEMATWQSFIKTIVSIPGVFVHKKFTISEGNLVFCWSIQIVSENLLEVIEKIDNRKMNIVDKVISNEQPSKIQNKKRMVQKSITVMPNGDKKEEWTINLPHVNSEQNRPKILEDGTLSSKGAFTIGSKEWSRAISYQKKKR